LFGGFWLDKSDIAFHGIRRRVERERNILKSLTEREV
jgi:hypothetical protein